MVGYGCMQAWLLHGLNFNVWLVAVALKRWLNGLNFNVQLVALRLVYGILCVVLLW